MKTTPILFSTEMVQAILAGNKTQTRRVVKPEPKIVHAIDHDASLTTERIFRKGDGRIHSPYGKPGDILWVREIFHEEWAGTGDDIVYYYKTDFASIPEIWEGGWKPSIFMPKAACRLFLKIKSVHVERLNDISEADAKAEGIENFLVNTDCNPPIYRNYMATYKDFLEDHYSHCANSAEHSYETLWQKINGSDSWDKNPFVWVVEFEKINKPAGF